MSFDCLEPAIDPTNRITFLLDWEMTMKCNLDCSYCSTDLENGGHNNTVKHPKKNECFKSVDFMLEYVDLYMASKSSAFKKVVLNVYGGESLHHPDIVEILSYVKEKYESYKHKWDLTVTTTTNLIVPDSKLRKILPFIDKFTVSYHSQNTNKQHNQFKNNILLLQQQNKNFTCVVLMNPKLFDKCTEMIKWLEINKVKFLPRQLDQTFITHNEMYYQPNQVIWFDNFYKSKASTQTIVLDGSKKTNLTQEGRACCGGRKLSLNQNYKEKTFYIKNNFFDWYCSVNHFFLFVKQVNGKIYTNKDCKMGFNGKVEPIGNLNNVGELLEYTKQGLQNKSLPTIQCKKSICFCGLCAPKSKDADNLTEILRKYQTH